MRTTKTEIETMILEHLSKIMRREAGATKTETRDAMLNARATTLLALATLHAKDDDKLTPCTES